MPTGCLQADGARGFIKKSPINWLLVNNLETHTQLTHTHSSREKLPFCFMIRLPFSCMTLQVIPRVDNKSACFASATICFHCLSTTRLQFAVVDGLLAFLVCYYIRTVTPLMNKRRSFAPTAGGGFLFESEKKRRRGVEK